MRIVDFLDKGASLGPQAPCLTTDGETLTYADVRRLSFDVAAALVASGVEPGDKIAILSANDPVAFACVFGISRAGAVWCPINPRNEAAENRELLDLFDCSVLVFHASFAPLVKRIRPDLAMIHTWVCLDGSVDGALTWDEFLARGGGPVDRSPVDDLAMIVGTGGTTGRPKGVMLTGTNLETMTALTLMGYPFDGRPVYLALAPLTHAAGVLCFPILCHGGEIVIMRGPDVGAFIRLIEAHRVTHTFLPPTLIYMVLGHEALDRANLTSLQCFWYGAAPISATRLAEALQRIGPVMAQLFGQTEAPMMISMMPPADHFRPDGSIAAERLSSAGRPSPLVTVAIMDPDGRLLDAGARGEIVVRSSLVTPGYYKNPQATAEASAYGWHHTGDIGYLDDGYLFIVDRAKDMIITGGFNVYSTEVEQAIMRHPDVQDCAVIGLPDDKWGERIEAVVQPFPGHQPDAADLIAFVKERLGSVKAPKAVHIWTDLPRSKVGKIVKVDVKRTLTGSPPPAP
ncbi:acyl-CoA synthetase [Phytohabitans rumicis]|uniref:AMP-dependent acyl-CoA synthetase n=1 Tax=Phytohabitans rumicis TaxID=1076125 RepID=A0A6V8KU23_9ACTN|nr:long-chain fatty acid--CoA ligase [Phytohabitans rumicis]GFJ86950.1 AMP-dependent acyl-CoA synthetase [Phytohabitans rumicis]